MSEREKTIRIRGKTRQNGAKGRILVCFLLLVIKVKCLQLVKKYENFTKAEEVADCGDCGKDVSSVNEK